MGRSSPSTPFKRASKSKVQIVHPTHPFRGQVFDVVLLYGGKQDSTQILIALPNGEQQLIPVEWTDQVNKPQFPPGVLFPFEHLVVLRQRLDHLLGKEDRQAILMAEEQELDRPGGSYVNQRTARALASIESRTASPDYCASCSDVTPSMEPGNGDTT